MISNKTQHEIIGMDRKERHRWYKTIEANDKLRAMQLMKVRRIKQLSESRMGINNPFYGKKRTKASIEKQFLSREGYIHDEETKRKIGIGNKGKKRTEDFCIRQSARLQGIDVKDWTYFKKYEDYCSAFNYSMKEQIRNLYGRVCVVCGNSALQNKRRLDVDHVDENKMQGCDDWEWRLAPLCQKCHGSMNNKQNHLLFQLLLLHNKQEEINMFLEAV